MKTVWLISFIILTNVLSAQNRYDVIITEIMSDPSPQVGLPNNEWIELKNFSNSPINLLGWRIADASGQSGPIPEFILEVNNYVIICAASARDAMASFGTAISVTSFPSLDNDGEILMLKEPNGSVIHAVEYSHSWFQNELKKDGGWSLEMINISTPCLGSTNWKASNDLRGGTPGMVNSVNAIIDDNQGPELKYAYLGNDSDIILVFTEPLDSMAAAKVINYTIDGGISITSAETIPPLFDRVQLKTDKPLSSGTIYNIAANTISDCKGNLIGATSKTRVGLPVQSLAGDVIINEILFNPRPNANDYVELFNRSDKILDISGLYLANRNSSNAINAITQFSPTSIYLFPRDYIVITTDAENLALQYLVSSPDAVITRPSLPSYPDTEGFVLVLNQQGEVLDELHYKDDWHFKLLTDPEGVSLERLDPDAETQNAHNWHSAASTAGYGTPGYRNSQTFQVPDIPASFEINPRIFSPDNDGLDDIATVQYKISEPGYLANTTIFDATGRPVKQLVRNGLLGISGYWNWDGLDDNGRKLPVGTYILYTEIFNLAGKKKRFKNTVVIARKLK